MPQSKLGLCFIVLGAIVGTAFAQRDTVPGFEDPAILDRVMAGEIVKETKASSSSETRLVFRAFFNKVSPDAYVGLATDHAKYPQLFSEVKSAETTHVDHDRNEFDYKMDIVFKVGIFAQHVYPEGHQSYTRAPSATAEALLTHNITNYQEYLKLAQEKTRLIPYQGGILVYDDVDVVLQKENAQSTLIKNKLSEEFERFLTTFRKELQGNY